MKPRTKQIGKYLLKLALSGLALWFVFTKVEWTDLSESWRSASIGFILLAIVVFIVSKLAAILRLNLFLKAADINLSLVKNIKLHWLGMYYNLFLPGGAGGDGYKVYLLRKYFGRSIRSLTWIMILDRMGGLAAIGLLLSLGSLFLPLPEYVQVLAGAILLVAPGAGYVLMRLLFRKYAGVYFKALRWSVVFQLGQVLIALFLLLALGQRDQLLAYAMLFLISSVAAMLPISLGGLGARELAMIYMAENFDLDPALATSISLAFYAITALISLCGGYFSINSKSMELAPKSV